MGDTYSQVYLQIVFAVYRRQNFIKEKNREEIERYMCGISNNMGIKPYAIYCNPDHVHILVSWKPNVLISNYVKEIKEHTTKFIRKERLCSSAFRWQKGFGCFSYSKQVTENWLRRSREFNKDSQNRPPDNR